jgi:mono/diheme cytochrome c family protein
MTAGCSGLAGEPPIVATISARPTAIAATISLPQSAPDLALGAQVYAQNCTRCHGESGKGDGEFVQSGQVPSMVDFTDPQVSQDAAPVDWYEIVTNGRLDQMMPPWSGTLSTSERWAVTLYVYTLANTSERLEQGQGIWTEHCAECHGQTGEGTAAGAPLPNLLAISTTDALAALTNGITDKMPSFSDQLSEEERAAVVAYARTLSLSNSPLQVADAAATERAINPPVATEEVGAIRVPIATEEVGAVTAPVATEEVGAEPPVRGVVSGTVVNQTSGGIVPPSLPLTLQIYSSPDLQSQAQTFDGTVSADGSYRFESVPIGDGWQYVVSARYEQAIFNSDVALGSPANPHLDIPLNIYEVTDDPANIQVNGMLMIVENNAESGALQVVQIVSFNNSSDRVFQQQTNGAPASVSVRLPTGAVFEDLSRGNYLTSDDRTEVWDTRPVLPGESHVMHIAYALPYSGNISIEQAVDYAVNGQVEVLVANNGLSVSGEGLALVGTRQLGEGIYVSYCGAFSRAAGESLHYTVSSAGTTGAVSAPNTITVVAYVLIGVGLLALGAAFGFFVRDRKGKDSSVDANVLIKQIAELDALYEEGKLSETSYRKQRTALKAKLAARMKGDAVAKEQESNAEQ